MNKNIAKVLSGLTSLSILSDKYNVKSESVSQWSIALHVDHLLKVNNKILDRIEKSEPTEEAVPLSLIGRIVLITNYIPRGKAKAPEFVMPEQKSPEELLKFIAQTQDRFKGFSEENLNKKIIFNHHMLGGMNPKQWMRFAYVHQNHHLKIIKEILGKV